MARRGALVSMAVLVASVVVPQVAHKAAAAPAAGNPAAPSASPHDAMWTQPRVDMRAAAAAVKRTASSSSPSTRTYEGTNPPNPCYYSLWSDPLNDAPELDVASYGAIYDCPS